LLLNVEIKVTKCGRFVERVGIAINYSTFIGQFMEDSQNILFYVAAVLVVKGIFIYKLQNLKQNGFEFIFYLIFVQSFFLNCLKMEELLF